MAVVWRGMTQEELDKAYDQAAYAPNMQVVIARFASSSERVRQRIGSPARFAYGPGENEGLDVYSPVLPHKVVPPCWFSVGSAGWHGSGIRTRTA